MDTYRSVGGTRIFVSGSEEQGRRALERGGPKPRERQLWSIATGQFDYQSVFDLGANYGQVVLDTTYPAGVSLTLVEANPALLPYLERTVAEHPNASQVKIHNLALGETEGSVDLFVRHEALGKSSLIRKVGEPVSVPMQPLDAIATHAAGNSIFKIDVEGAELELLRGAAETFARLDNYALMVELHPGFMRRTAGSLGQFIEILCQYGYLWELAPEGHLRTFNFVRYARKPKMHDVLVVQGRDFAQRVRAFNKAQRQQAAPTWRQLVSRLRG